MRRLAPVTLLLLVGCRSVWVHPEATAEKYADDLFFCQHGVERSEWMQEQHPATASDRAWALEGAAGPGAVNRGWKRCMLNLGWDTTVGPRSAPSWKKPGPPKSGPGGPK